MSRKSYSDADLHENIAAIAAELHGDKRYAIFYKRHCDRVGGFPGIYRMCIDAAKVYAKAEVAAPYKHEWLEAIEAFVSGMFELDYCSEAELRTLAERCIADYKTDMKEVQS